MPTTLHSTGVPTQQQHLFAWTMTYYMLSTYITSYTPELIKSFYLYFKLWYVF